MLLQRFLFLVYPVVTERAFQSFSCYNFDAGLPTSSSWLRADVRIECGTKDHSQAQTLGLAAILTYPVGLILLFGGLLYTARVEIKVLHEVKANGSEVRATPLATGVGYLVIDI